MIIRKEINLQNMANQISKQCPGDVPEAFKDGFEDFIESYFRQLESMFQILYLDSSDGANIDLEIMQESTLFELGISNTVKLLGYCEGVNFAIRMTNETIFFVCEGFSQNQAS